ncbi:DMT family transporter [Anaerosalibacter sp. Marseille-P3206]|uniref:DMT family transporter n=1 Tax=Anaerosalibacter sp. Marseille-P3206 TaxID=1871005 RepID=UPI0009865652|nr:DMT family transporter [Anaerosalibacter sp. Marseille-P3206]
MNQKLNNNSLRADLSLLLVAIIWGSGFVATKSGLDHITPLYMLVFRFGISTILLGLVFRKRIKKTTIGDFKAGIVIGIFLFLGFSVQTFALQFTTASKQAFITGTNVVMVPFLYWAVSKKKPDNYDVLGAILCFTGIGILSVESGFKIGFGDSLTLLCAVFYAAHIVAIGYYAQEHDPIILAFFQIMWTFILSCIFAPIFEPMPTVITKEMAIPIVYLAVFSTTVAFLLQNLAQKHTSSTKTAIILSMESVFGSLFSFIVLKEPFTIKFLIGCIAILLSIITTETKWSFLKKA